MIRPARDAGQIIRSIAAWAVLGMFAVLGADEYGGAIDGLQILTTSVPGAAAFIVMYRRGVVLHPGSPRHVVRAVLSILLVGLAVFGVFEAIGVANPSDFAYAAATILLVAIIGTLSRCDIY